VYHCPCNQRSLRLVLRRSRSAMPAHSRLDALGVSTPAIPGGRATTVFELLCGLATFGFLEPMARRQRQSDRGLSSKESLETRSDARIGRGLDRPTRR
jgi:hypothetical protein